MQWSADATEHAHVQEIKIPARMSNNQNYYEQIARYLDRSDRCFRFDVATYFQARREKDDDDDVDLEQEDNPDFGIDSDVLSSLKHMSVSHQIVDYFAIANALASGSIPNALKPHCTFSSSTTAFHIANKPSLRMTINEAADLYGIPDLRPAIWHFLQRVHHRADHPVSGIRPQELQYPLPSDCLQIWYKLRVQQPLYHDDKRLDAPQTLRAVPPSNDRPHGLYDTVITSPGAESDWPQRGIQGNHTTILWSVRSVLRHQR